MTVHESAEAIPDAAMRDEVVREGDVDAFFNGSDGKIHLLADRVNSLSDAERLLKHEGFHWAVGGKLRVEYGQLVAAIGRKIPSDRMQEIIARYPKGTPELWVEEYLAHLAETNRSRPSGGNSSTRSSGCCVESSETGSSTRSRTYKPSSPRHSSARPEQRPPTPPSLPRRRKNCASPRTSPKARSAVPGKRCAKATDGRQ